jgi:4'-phosphopantetheinyl transferase
MDEDAVQVQWRPAAGTGGQGLAASTASSRLVASSDQDAVAGLDGSARRDITVIGIAAQADRDHARRAIRAAILAELALLSGLPPDRIALHADPGEAPYALLAAPEGPRQVWLAISHDGELSVAAISLHGAVGIDVTRIIDIPDWEPVARDYLGPKMTQALGALDPPARAAAFARAWSEREARLKCLGWPIAEWNPEAEPVLQACRCAALDFSTALPEGYVGALALPPR